MGDITGKTLSNLTAAFGGESNARARYTAFAARAEEEGYYGAAALFRAASEAEGIHVRNHAAVINKMGGKAGAIVDAPIVGSTADNLAAAYAGECHERDVMYPEFIATAEAEGAHDEMGARSRSRARPAVPSSDGTHPGLEGAAGVLRLPRVREHG